MRSGSQSFGLIEHLIEGFAPDRIACDDLRGHGKWCLRFAPNPELIFGLVDEGCCQIRDGASEAVLLESGDFLLAPADAKLVLVGPAAGPTQFCADQVSKGANPEKSRFCDAITTRIKAGHSSLPDTCGALAHAIGSGLVVRRSAGVRVQRTLACLDEECRGSNSSSTSIQQKLMQVLVLQACQAAALRLGPEVRTATSGGVVAALRAMRAEPAHNWSVASLAAIAFMSRSAFARQFEQVVGQPPLRYLRELRMSRAKRALLSGTSIKATAALAGFQSDKAFRTAFRERFAERPDEFKRSRLTGANADGRKPMEDAS